MKRILLWAMVVLFLFMGCTADSPSAPAIEEGGETTGGYSNATPEEPPAVAGPVSETASEMEGESGETEETVAPVEEEPGAMEENPEETPLPPEEPEPVASPEPAVPMEEETGGTEEAPVPEERIYTTCEPGRLKLGYGGMEWGRGTYDDITIVAPHGGYDIGTEHIVQAMAEDYSVNYVIATGYRNADGINVNRPTEKWGEEVPSDRAETVYEVFKDCVDQYDQRYYIEIHGNSRASTAYEIQVATVNVDAALANFIKARWDAHAADVYGGYAVKIEPVDRIYWTAGANKRVGMMSHCDNICLHFELPRALRESGTRERTAEVLALLVQDINGYTG